MAKSVEDRGPGARMARRDEGAYCRYVTEEHRRQPGCLGHAIDRLSHSRALSCLLEEAGAIVAYCSRRLWECSIGMWQRFSQEPLVATNTV